MPKEQKAYLCMVVLSLWYITICQSVLGEDIIHALCMKGVRRMTR